MNKKVPQPSSAWADHDLRPRRSDSRSGPGRNHFFLNWYPASILRLNPERLNPEPVVRSCSLPWALGETVEWVEPLLLLYLISSQNTVKKITVQRWWFFHGSELCCTLKLPDLWFYRFRVNIFLTYTQKRKKTGRQLPILLDSRQRRIKKPKLPRQIQSQEPYLVFSYSRTIFYHFSTKPRT